MRTASLLHGGNVLGQCLGRYAGRRYPATPPIQDGSLDEELFEKGPAGVETQVVDPPATTRGPACSDAPVDPAGEHVFRIEPGVMPQDSRQSLACSSCHFKVIMRP